MLHSDLNKYVTTHTNYIYIYIFSLLEYIFHMKKSTRFNAGEILTPAHIRSHELCRLDANVCVTEVWNTL